MLCNNFDELKKLGGKILLLVCCAPCCCSVIEWLVENNVAFSIFFYNPNIYPEIEYLKRKDEVVRVAKQFNIEMIDSDYTPGDYVNSTIGMGGCGERGRRCEACFLLRLSKTARMARNLEFDYFTSTLAFSRWKSLEQVAMVGERVSGIYNIPYININWRKGGLQERSVELVRDMELYSQGYCGCVWSKKIFDDKKERQENT